MKIGRTLPKIEGYAREYKLDFFPTIFEVLDYDQINMVASYGGFPVRYPHWRFGMDYERMSKGQEYGMHKIYEMVINNNPCYAYLLESNSIVEQKTVIAHVLAHNDFFKNNEFFRHTNRRMIDEMANHAIRIRRYIERFGIEAVEDFIDICLSIDNLIDYHSPYFEDMDTNTKEDDLPTEIEIPKLPTNKEYMNEYINPASYIEAQKRKLERERDKHKSFPVRPVKDVLWFLIQHAPLTNWQRDVMAMMREEAYYFAPQGQTKILNEGWACVDRDTLVYTEHGLMPMGEICEGNTGYVSDGIQPQQIYDRNILPDHKTIEIQTKRGFRLCGSTNHRILLADGTTWTRLDQLSLGSQVAIGGGSELWPEREISLHWRLVTQHISVRTKDQTPQISGRSGYCGNLALQHQAEITEGLADIGCTIELRSVSTPSGLHALNLPQSIDSKLAALLGYLCSHSQITWDKHQFSAISSKCELAHNTAQLLEEIFQMPVSMCAQDQTWCVSVYSETIREVITALLDLEHHGVVGDIGVPSKILRSPEPVVRAFLRALCEHNVHIDDTTDTYCLLLDFTDVKIAMQVQLLLLNYGIISSRIQGSEQKCQLELDRAATTRLQVKIGLAVEFELDQSAVTMTQIAFEQLDKLYGEDEIAEITMGCGDVYDISVTNTHRYAAAGFINHNSFWHSRIMTERAATDSEIIDFADSHAGVVATSRQQLNPYKLGLELFRDIEERWDKGRFGKEYDECDDLHTLMNWDLKLGLGRGKIFQVRRIYNDVTFIDEFLTEDFCRRHKLFGFDYNRSHGRYEISTREFFEIKEKLLFQLTNFGQPFIRVLDANFENHAELLLGHRHEGIDLRIDYARAVLSNLYKIWRRPIHISTRLDNRGRLLSFDGNEHSLREYQYIEISS
jgi:stage V sporulation protein R